MRITIIAAILAGLLMPAAPAAAQWSDRDKALRREQRLADKQYRRDVRAAKRAYKHAIGAGDSDWRQAGRYDWDRPAPGQDRYRPERHYRDGRFYPPRALGRGDRVYRSQGGLHYCRRGDGTTGLVVGALNGGALAQLIVPGGSAVLGTLLETGLGWTLADAIDRQQITCR